MVSSEETVPSLDLDTVIWKDNAEAMKGPSHLAVSSIAVILHYLISRRVQGKSCASDTLYILYPVCHAESVAVGGMRIAD